MRRSTVERATAETSVKLTLCLDGTGIAQISTGVGFLDHMLTLFARHGNFDLNIEARGDVEVDFHHTVEDVGICLGQAISEALGNKAGISRYGDVTLPMDEALVLCAADVSGRPYLSFDMTFPTEKIGEFDSELIEEFFAGLVRQSGLTLHLKKLDGRNSHHIAEAAFKAFARALAKAVAADPCSAGRIPSTKGIL